MGDSLIHADALADRATSEPSPASTSAPETNYGSDFALWIEQQVAMLRERRFDGLDVAHLIEEIDSIGKSDRRELASRIETLLMHLLKCQFQPEMKCGSWLSTWLEQRSQIGDLLEDSPSLQAQVEPLLSTRFHRAVARAALETEIPSNVFPAACIYSVDQVLDVRFIP